MTPSHADTLVPDRLLVLGGYTPADTRVSWLPAQASGYQPSNAYLALEPGRAILIDTGIAAFGDQVLEQLAAALPPDTQLSIFLTRPELDTIGNLGPITNRFPVIGLHTGGTNNPFDAFDDVQPVRDGRVQILREMGKPIALSDTRSLHILNAPLRLLATYWVYDDGTGTLFTSDAFGHVLVGRPGDSRIAQGVEGPLEDLIERYLLTKLDWIADAVTDRIAASLSEIFEQHEVEAIAPANGCVIQGQAEVQRHYEAMLRVLARQGTRRRPRPSPPPGPVEADPRSEPLEQFLPREIADSIFWLGGCVGRPETAFRQHVHMSPFLLLGTRETLIVDTGHPAHWTKFEGDLDRVLAGRTLDWILPTHSETPHCGNLNRLMAKFPNARIVGDTRDYHLHYPLYADRLVPRAVGDVIDLGDLRLELLPALVRDLPATQWAYEHTRQVLFVADAFGYTHESGANGDPVHQPGECGLLSSELAHAPTVEQTAFLTKAALYWTRYVDIQPYFERVEDLMRRYPTRIVAPAHANVISDLPALMPMMHEAYRMADAM